MSQLVKIQFNIVKFVRMRRGKIFSKIIFNTSPHPKENQLKNHKQKPEEHCICKWYLHEMILIKKFLVDFF